jgi:hypothetical protein
VFQDALIHAGRLGHEYYKANKHARTHAYMLAEDIYMLRRHHKFVCRSDWHTFGADFRGVQIDDVVFLGSSCSAFARVQNFGIRT